MRAGSLARIAKGKQIPLEPLVAKLAAEEQVGPLVREPVISRAFQGIAVLLHHAGFGPEMFHVSIGDVSDL